MTRRAEAASTSESPPRSYVGLLRDPVFGPFLVGKLLVTAGMWAHSIAAALLIFEQTRSATLVGAVSIAQFLPQLLLTFWTGAAADRGDRRRQLVAGRLVTAAGSATVLVLLTTTGATGTAAATVLIACTVVVGIGNAIGTPAMHALVPSMVRPDELPAAVAMNSMPHTVGRVVGPVIGATLVGVAGPGVFLITAAANVVFALVLRRLRLTAGVGTAPRARGATWEGVRHVRGDRRVRRALVGVGLVGLGADPVITLTPSLADQLGAHPSFVGTLASSFGIGAAAGYAVLRVTARVAPEVRGPVSLLVMGVATAAAGAGSTSVAVVAFALAGGAMSCSLTSFTTGIQQQVPDAIRGRVMALWSLAFLGSRPVAAAVNGAVADRSSAATALVVAGAGLTVGALATLTARGTHRDAVARQEVAAS